MKDEKITIRVRGRSLGNLYIDSDREISGYKHTVFTYVIKLRSDGEVIKKSFIGCWCLGYFKKIGE